VASIKLRKLTDEEWNNEWHVRNEFEQRMKTSENHRDDYSIRQRAINGYALLLVEKYHGSMVDAFQYIADTVCTPTKTEGVPHE